MERLQQLKGFKSSNISEKKARKKELYDDFVDEYSKIESKEITQHNILSKKTKKNLIILFIIAAFTIGIIAGISTLNEVEKKTDSNITIGDSAFAADTPDKMTNMTNNTTTQKTMVKKPAVKKTQKTQANIKNSTGKQNSKKDNKNDKTNNAKPKPQNSGTD